MGLLGGDTIKTIPLFGKLYQAVATMKDAVDTLNRIGVQLGLTPKGRKELMEIASEDTNKASTADMLKEFLGK